MRKGRLPRQALQDCAHECASATPACACVVAEPLSGVSVLHTSLHASVHASRHASVHASCHGRYEEQFSALLPTFVECIWNLLMALGP
jgi:hypothetical protein